MSQSSSPASFAHLASLVTAAFFAAALFSVSVAATPTSDTISAPKALQVPALAYDEPKFRS